MSRGKRRSLDSGDRFQEEQQFVFGSTAPPVPPEVPTEVPTGMQMEAKKPTEQKIQAKPKVQKPVKTSPWSDLEPTEKEASIRLNVDIPISLNDRLAAQARKLRKPKTELVRHLLEWALSQADE